MSFIIVTLRLQKYKFYSRHRRRDALAIPDTGYLSLSPVPYLSG
jgi:hypothetical protein